MMHKFYWFGYNLGTFLFPGYDIRTIASFTFTCIGLICLALLYEGMKILQIKLQQNTIRSFSKQNTISSENSTLLTTAFSRPLISSYLPRENWYLWLFEVLHWSLHTILGYLLMMAIMTFNVYVTATLTFGACLGYFIFGPALSQMNLKQFCEKQKLMLECNKNCSDIDINEDRHSTSNLNEELTETIQTAVIDIHAVVCV